MVANENFNLELQNEDEEFIVNFGETTVLGSGGGAVSSVNGHTGDVVLTTSDLENTSDYQTGDEVETAIGSAITDKQDKLTAGDNITISEQNVISATDTTYSDFTGTDGTTAGTAGLVPAPAITDINKFLKSDGTWSEAGGGNTVITLTSADYNYHSSGDTDDGVAIWKLEPGLYDSAGVKIYIATGVGTTIRHSLYVCAKTSDAVGIFLSQPFVTSGNWTYRMYRPNTGERVINDSFMKYSQIVNSTGTSTSDVMSQKAVTDMIYASGYDPSTGSSDGNRVAIGGKSTAGARTTIAIGAGRLDTSALAIDSVALGEAAAVGNPSYRGSVALGSYAVCTAQGQVQIGSTQTSDGYNSSNYRLLSGLYDGQSAHDAVTLGQLNGRVLQNAGAPTTATVGTVGQLLEDTTNGKLYQCTAVVPGTDPDPDTYTWEEVGAGGGGPTVVQSTGSSTTDVMSQDAVTKELFYNHNRDNVQIGYNANAQNSYFPTVSIGKNSKATGGNSLAIGTSTFSDASATIAIGNLSHSYNQGCITIGYSARAEKKGSLAIGGYSGSSDCAEALKDGSIALGLGSHADTVGEFNIGERTGNYGYNNSTYRLLTGLYDGQSAHDAVTVEQVNATIDAINTALSVNIPHIGAAS